MARQAGVTGRQEEIHWSHTGMAMRGQRTPDRRNMGKMMAREAWIT